MFDIDGGPESPDVFRDIIAENNGSHRGFACSTLAHEQDFPLFLAFRDVHVGCGEALIIALDESWCYQVRGQGSHIAWPGGGYNTFINCPALIPCLEA